MESRYVKLCYVYSQVQLELVRGLLDANNIPVMVKRDSIGRATELYSGQSTTGADILVPIEMREMAKELVTEFNSDEAVEISDEEIFESTNSDKQQEIEEEVEIGNKTGMILVALGALLGIGAIAFIVIDVLL